MNKCDYEKYINLSSMIEMIIEDYEFHVKKNKDYETFGAGVVDILEMSHLIDDK